MNPNHFLRRSGSGFSPRPRGQDSISLPLPPISTGSGVTVRPRETDFRGSPQNFLDNGSGVSIVPRGENDSLGRPLIFGGQGSGYTPPTTREGGAIGVPLVASTPTYTPIQSNLVGLANQIASQVRVPTAVTRLDDVFSQEEQRLARESIRQRVARYLDPKLNLGLENIGTNFANRGLFRSGMREGEQGRFRSDIEEQRATSQEELFNIRLQEAQERLREQQRRREEEAAQAMGAINFSQILGL